MFDDHASNHGPEGPELYIGWSVVPEYDGARDVVFSWFRTGREQRLVDPRVAVADFVNLADIHKRLYERWLLELLTPEDVRLLRRALREEKGLSLRLVPVRLPIRRKVCWTGMVPTTFFMRIMHMACGDRSFGAVYDPRYCMSDVAWAD
jgi:hypothetical protein